MSEAEEAVVRKNIDELVAIARRAKEHDVNLLISLVGAWDAYRMGDVARFMAVARARVGLTVPERNKDR